ncbi:MAG: divalent cation tolerance protein CutA [Synergistaceae bacterium]|nr:divalent cation tolerance protein CutA [Synergistaceae bacterium]
MEFCKLEIFIPESHLRVLQETLRACGAGHIGKYDSCMSYSRVKGTWRPLEGSSPYSGVQGVISEDEEIKAEVTCRIDDADSVIEAVKKIHPYEEPVINAIPLLRTGL